MLTQPHPIDHVGLTVPDIERAAAFYSEVLGFQVVMGPVEMTADDPGPLGTLARDIFGERFRSARVMHMISANGAGMELFEWLEPAVRKPEDNFAYEVVGPFHFNVVDPDIEGLVEKVVAAGGRQRSRIHAWDPELPFRLVYLEDPFGNIFEAYTHPYAQVYASLAATQGVTPVSTTWMPSACSARKPGVSRVSTASGSPARPCSASASRISPAQRLA